MRGKAKTGREQPNYVGRELIHQPQSGVPGRQIGSGPSPARLYEVRWGAWPLPNAESGT